MKNLTICVTKCEKFKKKYKNFDEFIVHLYIQTKHRKNDELKIF